MSTSAWTVGRCWLYCRRNGLPVMWVGSVQTAGVHHANPAAAELLALFAGDWHLDSRNATLFLMLVSRWAQVLREKNVNPAKLTSEHELWLRGEL